jgi:hypothetical protein
MENTMSAVIIVSVACFGGVLAVVAWEGIAFMLRCFDIHGMSNIIDD